MNGTSFIQLDFILLNLYIYIAYIINLLHFFHILFTIANTLILLEL